MAMPRAQSFKDRAKEKLRLPFGLRGKSKSVETGKSMASPQSVGGEQSTSPPVWTSLSAEVQRQLDEIDKGRPRSNSTNESNGEKRRSRHVTQPKGTIQYEVKDRDSLNSIAAFYDTTPSHIVKINKLVCRTVFPGQTLYIPDKDYVPEEVTTPDSPPVIIDVPSPIPVPSHNVDLHPPIKSPGHAERVFVAMEPEVHEVEPPRPLSEEEAQKLDEECHERFIKINVKHITCKQGTVRGVLLVTPNAIMFDPDVSDPLVIERGADMYGMMAPMEMIISAAMYHDITQMRGTDKSGVLDAPKPQIYHTSDCAIFEDSIEHPQSEGQSDLDLANDIKDDDVEEEKDEMVSDEVEKKRMGWRRSRTVSQCSCGADALQLQLDKVAEKEDLAKTDTPVQSESESLNVGQNNIDAEHVQIEETEAIETEKTVIEKDKDNLTSEFVNKLKSSSTSSYEEPESEEIPRDVQNPDKVITDEPKRSTDVMGTVQNDQVSPQEKGLTESSQVETDNLIANIEEHVDFVVGSVDSAVGDLENLNSEANLTYNEVDNSTIPVERVPQKRDEKTDLPGDGKSDKEVLDGKVETTVGDGVEAAAVGEEQDVVSEEILGKSPQSKQGLLQKIGSVTMSNPNLTAIVDFSSGLFTRNQEDRGRVKDIHDVSTSEIPVQGQENANSPQGQGQKAAEFVKKTANSIWYMGRSPPKQPVKPVDSIVTASSVKRTGFEVENAVKLVDKPELFQAIDDLLPVHGPPPEIDPPLYLCLKIGMPINKQVSQTCPIESYNKRKKKPEYWFSIPRERVDPLYAFFIQWSPNIYGDEEDIDAREKGFVVIEDEEEELEELEVSEEHFSLSDSGGSGPRGKPRLKRQMTKDWEIVNVEEARRRLELLEVEDSLPLPELRGTSEILTEEHISKLARKLPARAEGYPWILVYSSEQHGFSLKTLYRQMLGLDTPILLVVKDTNQNVFGCLTSCPLKMSDHFYGTGESFLFTFYKEFEICPWTGENNFFIKGNAESLAIGAGEGSFGLWVDGDIYHGRSQACQTYGNEPLVGKEDFVIKTLEAWGFEYD